MQKDEKDGKLTADTQTVLCFNPYVMDWGNREPMGVRELTGRALTLSSLGFMT